MESVRPSCQKLGFCHVWAWAWPEEGSPHAMELGRELFFGGSMDRV